MNMETEINGIKLKCAVHDANYEVMCKDIKEIKEDLREIKEMLDQKYAAKWVEKFAILIIGIFALASLYFIFERVGLPH